MWGTLLYYYCTLINVVCLETWGWTFHGYQCPVSFTMLFSYREDGDDIRLYCIMLRSYYYQRCVSGVLSMGFQAQLGYIVLNSLWVWPWERKWPEVWVRDLSSYIHHYILFICFYTLARLSLTRRHCLSVTIEIGAWLRVLRFDNYSRTVNCK